MSRVLIEVGGVMVIECDGSEFVLGLAARIRYYRLSVR